MLNSYLACVLPILLALPAASAEENVFVKNDRHYVGNDGTLHIVGEVHNGLDYTIDMVSIEAALFSESGEQVGTADTSAMVRTVSSGMTTPFDIVITDHGSRNAVGYTLGLDYSISAPKSQVIEIVHSELMRDSLDNVMVAGAVANRGQSTANMVSVVATVYDMDGNVAAAARLHTEPDYLRSGDTAHFVVPIHDKVQTQHISGYTLVAESEEYAAVPEFPIGSGLLLAAGVGAYVLATRIPNRIISRAVCAVDRG